MTAPPAPRGHDLNVVSLRDYVERILDERDKAVQVAYRNMELRLDKLNELRAEVSLDRSQFLRFDVYDERHAALASDLENLETALQSLEKWRAVHSELGAHPQAIQRLTRIEDRIKPIEDFRAKAVLIAAGLVSISGVVGAAIARAIWGGP